MSEMTLTDKTVEKEEVRIRVLRRISILGRMRKELGVSTAPLGTSPWKTRAIQC